MKHKPSALNTKLHIASSKSTSKGLMNIGKKSWLESVHSLMNIDLILTVYHQILM